MALDPDDLEELKQLAELEIDDLTSETRIAVQKGDEELKFIKLSTLVLYLSVLFAPHA